MAVPQFIKQLQAVATLFAQTVSAGGEVGAVYDARGYAVGGAHPITDADLTGTGMTAADVAALRSMLAQLQVFATTGNYSGKTAGQVAAIVRGDF